MIVGDDEASLEVISFKMHQMMWIQRIEGHMFNPMKHLIGLAIEFLQRLIEWRDGVGQIGLHRALGALLMVVWSGNYYSAKNINPAGFLSSVAFVALRIREDCLPNGPRCLQQQYWIE